MTDLELSISLTCESLLLPTKLGHHLFIKMCLKICKQSLKLSLGIRFEKPWWKTINPSWTITLDIGSYRNFLYHQPGRGGSPELGKDVMNGYSCSRGHRRLAVQGHRGVLLSTLGLASPLSSSLLNTTGHCSSDGQTLQLWGGLP